MTYNFINQSDESLDRLRCAVYEEQKRRVYKAINKWPKPELFMNELGIDRVKSMITYRETHKCSLSEARWIIDYYINV